MTDRPILFSAPMVRALLDGHKTQTRRRLPSAHPKYPDNNQLRTDVMNDPQTVWYWDAVHESVGASFRIRIACGDRLWVREHWRADHSLDDYPPRVMVKNEAVKFIADGGIARGFSTFEDGRHRQGMHMPRWASRLTLTVTDVRVQRLQDISETDAQAEGIIPAYEGWATDLYGRHWGADARNSYRILWDDINGPGAWDKNPWVAAYSFTVHRGNIDNG